jgi:MoaA/NifB/PqqE/SkfB family radical SAM enzyme
MSPPRLAGLPGGEVALRSPGLRRIAGRLGLRPSNPRPVAPSRPIGAKLELTYSCNLRCGFCYTDSPRRTLERSTDLADDAWRRIAADVIELGVTEGVITGGEPLLRKGLALELFERLDAAGVRVTFNTNGWFVDEDAADTIAALSLASVNISLDGPTPELHDRARGVPGSWRRAVHAIALLRERGVPVRVTHVVTPDNELAAHDLIAQTWLLDANVVRIVPVVAIGAAARGGDWKVGLSQLRRTISNARREFGPDLDVALETDPLPGDPIAAPTYFVVRPNGAVMTGAMSPFRFGDAIEDGVASCWDRIRRDWDHPGVRAWRDPIARGGAVSDAAVVPYRDEEIDPSGPLTAAKPPSAAVLPIAAPSTQRPGSGDLESARAHIRGLALTRRYRPSAVGWSADEDGGRSVRSPLGGMIKLNATAAAVMDACSPGTPADAVAVLAARHPGRPAQALERDVLETTRRLAARGLLDGARDAPHTPVPASSPAGV